MSLDRTPAAELLPATLATWVDAIWPGRDWHESDMPRIVEAFRRLSATVRQWPAPAMFFDALPRRIEPRAPRLPRTAQTDADRRENEQIIASIIAHTASVLAKAPQQ